MRVLVTGGSGFVGKHVVTYLLEETDWEVVFVDHRYTDLFDEERSHFVQADLDVQWGAEFERAVGEVDAVFHLASKSDVRHALDHPVEHVHTNVDVTLHLLEWARRHASRLGHLVQVSTGEVYGPGPAWWESREWDAVAPVTPYSASKAAQEALAIAWWRSFEVPTVLVNTQHLFGEWQLRKRFIPTVVDRVLEGRPVQLVGSGPRSAQVRKWLHARDLADALRWVVDRGAPASVSQGRPDRWHVAGDTLNCADLAQRIADLLGRPLEVEWTGAGRTGYEQRYVLSTTKLDNAGWKPPIGFQLGLERAVGWAAETHRPGRD